jgi:protein-tyrosine phosphatase
MGSESRRLTDLHSHLVPGVDDGARTLSEALKAMETLRASGIQSIVTTPHLDGSLTHDPETFFPVMEAMDRAWTSLREEAKKAFPGLQLDRGHEVMLDIPDPDLSDSRIRLAETDFVLVEWPGLQIPPGTVPALEHLRKKGVRPIIAHPERYRGMDRELALAGEWRRVGAHLQVNYPSLSGRYGDGPRRRAVELLGRGWADLFSTDYHGRGGISPGVEEAWAVLADLGDEGELELLTEINPGRILLGQDPLPVPPLSAKKGFLDRLLSAFRI